jgi:hypothetical protein
MFNLNPELITKDGKPLFAVIPYEQFLVIREMLETLGDLEDLRVAKQEEKNQPVISLNEVRRIFEL